MLKINELPQHDPLPPITAAYPSKVHFEAIDVLRGFAAISVVVYHVIEHFAWKTFPLTGPLVWFRTGWMGVDLFFVISGFVIGLSAFNEIDKRGTKNFRSPFAIRRIARIVPLHYLTILVVIVFISPELLFNNFWANLIAHLLFIHNLSSHLHGAMNGSNWSLGPEMQFYAIIIVAGAWLRVARWWIVGLTFVGIAWSWRCGVLLFATQPVEPFRIFFWSTQTPGMLDEFVAGLLLARLMRTNFGHELLHEGLTVRLAVVLAAAFVVAVAMAIYWSFASYWNYPYMVVMFRTLLAAGFALIILASTLFEIKGAAKVVLAPFLYLGTISYGIYLWHLPVLLSVKRLTWIDHPLALTLTLFLTLIFASVSWHFFENPIIEK
jgi:peptidoglycan/LPS O-acetylase OafA/YrhL